MDAAATVPWDRTDMGLSPSLSTSLSRRARVPPRAYASPRVYLHEFPACRTLPCLLPMRARLAISLLLFHTSPSLASGADGGLSADCGRQPGNLAAVGARVSTGCLAASPKDMLNSLLTHTLRQGVRLEGCRAAHHLPPCALASPRPPARAPPSLLSLPSQTHSTAGAAAGAAGQPRRRLVPPLVLRSVLLCL
jgi:hypothetical protein